MKKIKVLNLYACLGGNRYKWDEVANIEVTAVELDEDLAKLYQERFPNDTVVVGDAHQYLLDHYKGFDFVWTSPPCPTHSRLVMSNRDKIKMQYPDMKLYQEIIFLDRIFQGKYVVENVIPYYQLLIPAQKRHRHLYWSNVRLPHQLTTRKSVVWHNMTGEIRAWNEFHDYDFYKYKGKQPRSKIARNLVDYEAGKTIFQAVVNSMQNKPVKQIGLFA